MTTAATEPERLTRGPQGALPITARGLSKSFGARTVIDGLDLHVPAGQFLAIVGRSGCGKSTLLRLLSGLEDPDAGRIAFGTAPGARSPIRLMFQEPRLLPWARVTDNVAVGLGDGNRTDVGTQTVAAALADVGLSSFGGSWPGTLSGGQKQRVALARALVSKPRVLAFDEPLGALDALTRIEMQRLIERVYLANQFTAVLVTHDVSEALALADRVIMLDNGKIALDLAVPFTRPRVRGAAEIAELEHQILSRLLNEPQGEAA